MMLQALKHGSGLSLRGRRLPRTPGEICENWGESGCCFDARGAKHHPSWEEGINSFPHWWMVSFMCQCGYTQNSNIWSNVSLDVLWSYLFDEINNLINRLWIKQIALLMSVGLIQSVEGCKRQKRQVFPEEEGISSSAEIGVQGEIFAGPGSCFFFRSSPLAAHTVIPQGHPSHSGPSCFLWFHWFRFLQPKRS